MTSRQDLEPISAPPSPNLNQASDAHYFYQHGYGPNPELPLFTRVKALSTRPHVIEFWPVRVK